MMKISYQQKKILLIATIVVFAFGIFWFALYAPVQSSVKRLKVELRDTEEKILAIEMILNNAQNMDEGIRLLKEESLRMQKMFPSKEQESLKILSDLARKNNVAVISMQPGSKVLLMDKNDQKIEAETNGCYKEPISLNIRCDYKSLVTYLESLKESLPALHSVQKLKIEGVPLGFGKLDVVLDINLYLL